MRIIVNGESREVAAPTLAGLLNELGYDGNWLATAVNGEVVPSRERTDYTLSPGDRIEILSPMKGG